LQRETNNCQEAINNYNQVILDYEKTEFNIRKYEARKGRLLCFAALKNDAAVREEIPELLQIFDDNRQKITEESERITFFDNEQNVYDIAIDYSYTQLQNSEQAFNYAENSRARSLLGLMRNNQSKPLTLPEIRQRISPKAQIVYYALLADKILIWHISDTKLSVSEKPIKADEINDKIQKYREFLIANNDNNEIADLAKELHQLLIQPIESMLEPDKSLCIIADKILFRVPFAPLVSSQTNKYLIEDYALFYAPSATIFINETEKASQQAVNQNETILSVGNPSFSRKEYPELNDLPDAAREAGEIASLYKSPNNSPKVLVNDEAVKEQIAASLNEADVFHFAGHYVANGKSASLSKFLLASGELSVDEIMQKKLSRTRLMILPACETGVERFYNGEGMIGAARAFLASGVPLVVASQWSVESKATAELMIKFHRFRKLQKLPTIAALRRAQMEMLNDENPRFRQPVYWAGFLPIGGFAEY
jgi:CHAT domain-containing protein